MASMPHLRLSSWKDIEARSDLERLCVVLAVIPDKALMRKLETFRGTGRDDHPVRAVWNALMAPRSSASFSGLLAAGAVTQWGVSEFCEFDPL